MHIVFLNFTFGENKTTINCIIGQCFKLVYQKSQISSEEFIGGKNTGN